jgi:hypothetical protein
LTRPYVNPTTLALDGVNTFTCEFLHPAVLSTAEVDELYARAKEAIGLAIMKTAAENGAIPT